MGSFEFGIYVYVWTWVLVIGDLADLGLASAAQRFIPEYANAKAVDAAARLPRRQPLAHGRRAPPSSRSAARSRSSSLEPLLADYVVLPLMIACVTLPFYALMQMQDGIARSYNWIQLALLPTYVDPPRRHAGAGGGGLCC